MLDSDRKNAPKDAAWLQEKSIEELEDLKDDALLEDDRFLEQYQFRFYSLLLISDVVFFRLDR